MGSSIALEIPPRKEYLDVVRLVVATAAQVDPLFPERRLADVRLAVSEACTNAIEAHQRNNEDRPIAVECVLGEEHVVIEITDHGGGFDPDNLSPLPSVTDPARLEHERGLGLSLLRSLADDVTFSAEGDGTKVRLVVDRTTTGGVPR